MAERGLDRNFLAAMREGLERGRRKGYVGWDQRWKNCTFPARPGGFLGLLHRRLQDEMSELTVALERGIASEIFREAADVANFAMMLADFHK